MSIQINIGTTVIEFPSSAQSPNWAPALIEFAQTVGQQLTGIVGPYDIRPQVMDLPVTGTDSVAPPLGQALQFPTSQVRSAIIRYSVYRTNSVETHAESGTMTVVYNPNAAVGQKWEIQRDFIGNVTPEGSFAAPNKGIFFQILDTGQVQYSVATMVATGYTGKLSFAAQALLQTS